jgi:hypothetical protein
MTGATDMTDKNIGKENEGEGSRTADRAYTNATKDFIKSGRVEEKARDAAKAIDGPEGEELKRAEDAGRAKSHGEDPKLRG